MTTHTNHLKISRNVFSFTIYLGRVRLCAQTLCNLRLRRTSLCASVVAWSNADGYTIPPHRKGREAHPEQDAFAHLHS